jgi:hypothetical protein
LGDNVVVGLKKQKMVPVAGLSTVQKSRRVEGPKKVQGKMKGGGQRKGPGKPGNKKKGR